MDTEADISVFPASFHDRKSSPNSLPLVAANGSTIRTWGQRTIALHLGNRLFTQDFHIADVTRPILGADFFRGNFLAIDLAGRRLIDLTRDSIISASPDSSVSLIAGLATAPPNEFSAILADFPSLLVPRYHSSPMHSLASSQSTRQGSISSNLQLHRPPQRRSLIEGKLHHA